MTRKQNIGDSLQKVKLELKKQAQSKPEAEQKIRPDSNISG
jgi:uncharacterized protein YabE (DUF348 family)